MTALGLLLLALADPLSALTGVQLESENSWPVVRLVVSGPAVPAVVERAGRDLVVILPGTRASAGVTLPEPVAEVVAFELHEAGDSVRLTIRLEGDQSYELRQAPGVVSVLIRPAPAAAPSPHPLENVRDLYAKILPPPMPPPAGEGSAPAEGTGEADARPADGLRLGFIRLRPFVVVSYVDADSTFLDTPQPVRDRYFQIEPHLGFGLGAQLPLPGQGRLVFTYEPRFRAGTSFEQLRRPTHLATLSVDLPLGPAVSLRAGHHYAHGLLETSEVDPGREYFFRLAPFTRHETTAGLDLNAGGLIGLQLSGRRDSVRIADEAGFFDHRTDTLAASLNYQLGTASHAYVRYQFDRVPPPAERPLAESRASSVFVGLRGEVLPLVTGEVSAGFRSLSAPQAGQGGRRYRGTVGAASLKKEFSPTSTITAVLRRETYPSAFEENAFYVSTLAGLETSFGLPLSLVGRAGLGWQRNAYRVRASGLDEPRRDDLFSWSVGAGRSLTRWAFLRSDYRYDRRRSNLDLFQTHGHVFLVEFGLGYVNSSPTEVAPR
jgi:Putative beta-barrel porin 2